jgi:hypothetical protein
MVRDRGQRPVIVTIVGGVITLRAKGLRSTESLDLAWCYLAAVRQRVAQERLKKRKPGVRR